jgi:hypothetical protein
MARGDGRPAARPPAHQQQPLRHAWPEDFHGPDVHRQWSKDTSLRVPDALAPGALMRGGSPWPALAIVTGG